MYSFRKRWYAALALAAVGCSGGYADEANRICRDLQADVEEIPVPESPRRLGRYLEMNLRLSREANAAFARLEPPADLADEHRRLERTNERGELALERLARRVSAGPDPGETLRRGFRTLEPLVEESNRTARAAGLNDCIEELPEPEPPGTERS